MKHKKIASWLISFSILSLYTGFLLFADTHNGDGHAYAKDFTVEQSAHSKAPQSRIPVLAQMRNAIVKNFCQALHGHSTHCEVFFLPVPIIHVS
jgi:hypothetical protein